MSEYYHILRDNKVSISDREMIFKCENRRTEEYEEHTQQLTGDEWCIILKKRR